MESRSNLRNLQGAWTTYYEHRMFMVYFPDDFRRYLQSAEGPGWFAETEKALDLLAWGTLLVYQARMEPFRFTEYLNRYQLGNGSFRQPYAAAGTPRSNPAFRVQLTMQLALEVIMRRVNIEPRIEEFPTRAQLLFDTIYYIATLHDLEKARDHEFKITPSVLQAYLRLRAENDRGPGLDKDFPGTDELNFLFHQLHQYLTLLQQPSVIRSETLDHIRRFPDNPVKSLWLQLPRAIFPTTKPIVGNLYEIVSEQGERLLTFLFLVDRSGLSAADEDPNRDPLNSAPAVNIALGSWAELLKRLCGNATAGQEVAAGARILERTPGWGPIETARQLTRHLSVPSGQPARPATADAGPADDRNLRLAAVQMQDYLAMLDEWRRPLAEGILAACVAGAAAADTATGATADRDPATCRRFGIRALGAIFRFDVLEEPSKVDAFLRDGLAWPDRLGLQLRRDVGTGSSVSFTENPPELTTYCDELQQEVEQVETQLSGYRTPDWSAIWRDFWGRWIFEPTGVAALPENVQRHDSIGLQVLHAARHGGIPVIPPAGGGLSIGQWWRLLVLYAFGDEAVPPQAAVAAMAALGFPEEIVEFSRSDSYIGFDPRPAVNLPVLSVAVSSSRSPAWSSWRPDSRALVVMPPPPDLLRRTDRAAAGEPAGESDAVEEPAADNIAVRDPAAVAAGFELMQQRLLLGRRSSAVMLRLMRLFPFLRAIRRVELIECEEVTRDPPADVRPDRIYFGFGPAPVGLPRYIENPTSTGDLLEGIRRTGRLREAPPTRPASTPPAPPVSA